MHQGNACLLEVLSEAEVGLAEVLVVDGFAGCPWIWWMTEWQQVSDTTNQCLPRGEIDRWWRQWHPDGGAMVLPVGKSHTTTTCLTSSHPPRSAAGGLWPGARQGEVHGPHTVVQCSGLTTVLRNGRGPAAAPRRATTPRGASTPQLPPAARAVTANPERQWCVRAGSGPGPLCPLAR